MKSEWKTVRIGDISEIRRGASPRPIHHFLQSSGMPWVKIADATADSTRYIHGTKEYIKEEGIVSSVVVEPETLIVSNSATPGLPKIMKIRACVHDGWLVFSGFRGVERDFLYYKFVDIRTRLTNQANGSVFQNLKTDIVKDFEVKLPPIEVQERIVEILSSLDDKIETNNAICRNLEELADALFNKCIEEGNMQVPFLSLVEVQGGGTPKTGQSEYWSGEIPFFTPKDVSIPFTFETGKSLTREGLAHCNSPLYPAWTTFVTARGTVGKLAMAGLPMAMNQSCYALVGKKIHPILAFMYSRSVVHSLKKKSTGSVFDAIVTRDFETENVKHLSDERKFIDVALPMYERIYILMRENNRLAALRDTLLPRLMSGELDVSAVKLD